MDADEQLIELINREWDISIPRNITVDECMVRLSLFIEELIAHDFQKLIHILYRVDIDELKIKRILQDNKGVNAALIISTLIINRQIEKIAARKQFKKESGSLGEETW